MHKNELNPDIDKAGELIVPRQDKLNPSAQSTQFREIGLVLQAAT